MMLRNHTGLNSEATAADVVKYDYRTAEVFKRYGIEYCCGARWPLKMICETRDISPDELMQELNEACRVVQVPNSLPFGDWSIDFLIDYINNIHHQYLRQSLPSIKEHVEKFVAEHAKKYPFLSELQVQFNYLYKTMLPHLLQEEEVIFPYIRQIAHAYESQESYAGLLVRTLRKPVENLMNHEHDTIEKVLVKFRALTDNYTAPANACTSHKLAYSLLKELDDDLVQHLYLENEILFPRSLAMEKELLQRPA